MKSKVYTQVYSLLRTSQEGLLPALKTIAEIGWDGIEAMGSNTGGLSLPEFKAYIKDLGLDIISFHALRDEEDMAFAQEMGARFSDIRVPHGIATREAAMATMDQLNQQAEKLSKFGIQGVIHNHANEFFPLEGEDSGQCVYDLLLEYTDPGLVRFELDVGWAMRAGVDVVDYISRYPGRFPLLHVKECNAVGKNQDEMEHFPKFVLEMGNPQDNKGGAGLIKGAPRFTPQQLAAITESRSWNVPLGQGLLPWQKIKEVAESQGIQGYINEREYYNIPGGNNDAVTCSRLDYAFLRSL